MQDKANLPKGQNERKPIYSRELWRIATFRTQASQTQSNPISNLGYQLAGAGNRGRENQSRPRVSQGRKQPGPKEFWDSIVDDEIVRDLSAQLWDKITSINREGLEKMLEAEKNRLEQKWTVDTKFDLCPGKDLLTKMNKWLQNDFQTNLSVEEIIEELDDVDPDIIELLDKMNQLVTDEN